MDMSSILFVWNAPSAAKALAVAGRNHRVRDCHVDVIQAMLEGQYLKTELATLMHIELGEEVLQRLSWC